MFDLPDPDTSVVTGAWIYWPCSHGWRRWRDRLIGRRHPSTHGVYSDSVTDDAAPSGSVMRLRWDATGRVTVEMPDD